jgi:glutamate--cysteine ligase
MYFVFREGRYIDAAGQSFRDFLEGRLPALPGEKPSIGDWKDHLSTAFPEVRMKSFLEMRGADGGPQSRICALPAFWVGLLYDQSALDAAWDLVKGWSMEEREALRLAAPRLGLQAPAPGGRTLQDIALEALAIAEAGLQSRARLNPGGDSEAGFLSPLWEIARTGKTLADRWLDAYAGPWGGDITRVFEDARF